MLERQTHREKTEQNKKDVTLLTSLKHLLLKTSCEISAYRLKTHVKTADEATGDGR